MASKNNLLSYIDRDSPVHRLTGATKLIVFLLWTVVCMISYDTRVLGLALILSILVLKIARIKFSEIRTVVLFILIFLLLNDLTIYLFAPEQGVEIYGTRREYFRFTANFTVTREQLFYLFNVTLKYITIVPIALLFIVTTDPSEFAGSLTRLKLSYRVSYAVSITLRYIDDIQTDLHNISQAQQARGTDLSREAPLRKRIAGLTEVAIPLIFSSLGRIELISNAMDLRGFGKKERRTWYCERPMTRSDYAVLIVAALLSLGGIAITFANGGRFFNPFR